MTRAKRPSRQERLAACRQRFETRENVLNVWRAIRICLNEEKPLPLPDWVLHYLGRTAWKIDTLAQGEDTKQERQRKRPGAERLGNLHWIEVDPARAVELVPEALQISRRGSRNSFAALKMEEELIALALKSEADPEGALRCAETKLNITQRQARQKIVAGRKLLGRA